MSLIVRGTWGPIPFKVALGGKETWLGAGYGILGEPHPDLRQWRWVDWCREGWGSAYYCRRDLKVVGTAFIE